MRQTKYIDVSLKVCCALLLAAALALTFTVSDYYIFNRIGEFNFFFVISQWIKKAGLLLFPPAVFYKKRCCADIAKYVLPLFVIISMCTFGTFFDINTLDLAQTPADKVYASINGFMPREANISLFFISCGLYLLMCAMLFLRDGYKESAKSFIYLPFALVATMPLNIFENLFDINNFSREHFLWFKNFTIWHFLALAILVGFTVGCYYFLRKKDEATQHDYLAAAAIVLLIQYHSKDSMLLGDGYNVYHTIFAVIPLFICNIGVYVASLSVILKKRVLYAISFFVHAAGALTVFIYFGKDDMSNYGIICSYSILYFCLTHCILFALSVLPTALGHYKFKWKDCAVPLVYYCLVIIVAAISSGLVTSASMDFSYDGYTLQGFGGMDDPLCEWLFPNYAFTQKNPVPIDVPVLPLKIWKCELNVLYLICLYLVYVALFFSFIGGYYAFNAVRGKILHAPKAVGAEGGELILDSEITAETAATEDSKNENDNEKS